MLEEAERRRTGTHQGDFPLWFQQLWFVESGDYWSCGRIPSVSLKFLQGLLTPTFHDHHRHPVCRPTEPSYPQEELKLLEQVSLGTPNWKRIVPSSLDTSLPPLDQVTTVLYRPLPPGQKSKVWETTRSPWLKLR